MKKSGKMTSSAGGKRAQSRGLRGMARINELSKPKDRLKIGKTLLKMKSRFPKDKILRDMIVDQFECERVAKKPLEYDNFDSDEEEHMKLKHMMNRAEKPFIRDQAGDPDRLQKEEVRFELVKKGKEKELLGKFNEMVKKYNVGKNDELKQRTDYKKLYKEQEQNLNNYIKKKVREYKKLVNDKMNHKIPTETEFRPAT